MSAIKKFLVSILLIATIAIIGFAVFSYLDEKKEEEITFTVKDTLPDGNGKGAKVILLGGQSNASGCSRDEYLKTNVSAEKYAEYQNGYENVYINFFSTGSNKSEAFVKCGAKQGEAGGFFGPELGMAQKLNELYPSETFFIIKWAFGGSNLHEQWLSPSSRGKTGDFYKQFIGFVNSSLEYLKSKNYDVQIEGMCWMQGESDAFSEDHTDIYEKNLKNLISDLREEFSDDAADDGIAFIDAYISENWPLYKLINAAKQRVASSSPLNSVIDTISHGLTCSNEPVGSPDLAHYDATSELKLGNLFIESLSEFMK